MKFMIEVELSKEDIWYQLVGALEGGSNYWIDYLEEQVPKDFTHVSPSDVPYSNQEIDYHIKNKTYSYTSQLPVLGGSFTVIESGYDHKPKAVNAENILAGLKKMAEKSPRHMKDLIEETYDSTTSDVLLQYTVFGEIIYG